MPDNKSPSHFKGKDAIDHVVEAQAEGLMASAEIHGVEMPGHLSAGTDAAREMALGLLLLGIVLFKSGLYLGTTWKLLLIFALSWAIWKAGRSAWLGWSRLERLHRVLKQEKWEIEHNRAQEKEELKDLYAAKGFDGQLLEDAVDVLMADGDRLLRVMVEEELGLSLEKTEHPLMQGVGALVGALLGATICLLTEWLVPYYGLIVGSFVVGGVASAYAAYQIGNRYIPAIVWNLGLFCLSAGFLYFLIPYVLG
ncbi:MULTISPECIES: VIT1/CCC1 transporter family protein [Parachlamydia]|jgi:hypothetical protein|uniref:Uncharacterized protein n=2 Tax=Parachlamydia acanthamoebae TaxID=83552 RepID=F8KX85_PARAV|nr:VIT1/CCC1 transporter family protein [Parachlamydia acanthamoebae]EFB41410.1 hypothetical protein pah_c045o134 [Parachlamydia acanthamoebae str. Hall's coccus]CCB85552.1 putative uncharacterized protein [Parachlamydia acanthamoebae UV-7]